MKRMPIRMDGPPMSRYADQCIPLIKIILNKPGRIKRIPPTNSRFQAMSKMAIMMYVGTRWINKSATASVNGMPSPNESRANMLIKRAKSIPSILGSQ